MNATPTSGEARFDVDGPVATVTLDRPEVLNAQTPALWTDLRTFGRSLPGDVRVVIVRGSGRAFSAGLDTSVAATMLGGVSEAQIALYQEAFAWLRQPSLISIAAVHGHAIGAGFQLALACDFRVVAEDDPTQRIATLTVRCRRLVGGGFAHHGASRYRVGDNAVRVGWRAVDI